MLYALGGGRTEAEAASPHFSGGCAWTSKRFVASARFPTFLAVRFVVQAYVSPVEAVPCTVSQRGPNNRAVMQSRTWSSDDSDSRKCCAFWPVPGVTLASKPKLDFASSSRRVWVAGRLGWAHLKMTKGRMITTEPRHILSFPHPDGTPAPTSHWCGRRADSRCPRFLLDKLGMCRTQ